MTDPASFRPRGALGAGGDWRRRLVLHHLPIALASGAAVVAFMGLSPFTHRSIFANAFSLSLFTIATGYVATLLLALTLLIGPANLLLGRRNPVSSYLRRDLGTWTAIFSVVHVIVGFQVRGDGGPFAFLDFFVADGKPLIDSFGLGNWTGLAALVLVAGLLALSTNRSIRELKAERWKNLQRLNYTLFALVVLHAVFYGALSRPESPFTVLLVAIVTAVFAGQGLGIWLYRRRRYGRTAIGSAEQGAGHRRVSARSVTGDVD
jgi:sulfoxide reductase heme-binding subunit YedZ